MKLETTKKLVLNKSGKPIGERDITVTRDLMCYVERGLMFLVKPVDNRKEVDNETGRGYRNRDWDT